ncbi:MAG TPA: Rrf2 family transcriptional regulator [Candidatus Obscuribacterales bacterium]
MISQTAEYALRAVVFLALNPKGAFTAQEIAATTKVPPAYLSKVLKLLVTAEVVISQRGLGGGFSLAKKPEDINLLEIVNAVEPVERIRTCPLGLKAHGKVLCALHKRLDDVAASLESSFAETTVADLLTNPTPSVPLYEKLPRHACK